MRGVDCIGGSIRTSRRKTWTLSRKCGRGPKPRVQESVEGKKGDNLILTFYQMIDCFKIMLLIRVSKPFSELTAFVSYSVRKIFSNIIVKMNFNEKFTILQIYLNVYIVQTVLISSILTVTFA